MSLVELLEWDSDFFGQQIGRARIGIAADQLPTAAQEADKRGVRCLYLLADADDTALIESAQAQGFILRDVRVELRRAVAEHAAARAGLRSGQPADLSWLAPIARERFRQTRFFADHRFPRERSAELYVEWLRRGLCAETKRALLVTEDQVGFVLCDLDEGSSTGTVELIGVAAAAAGRGAGSTLMAGAGALFLEQGLACARVVTQGRNIAAQRLYQSLGYRTTGTSLWLHRWQGSPPASAPPRRGRQRR